VSLNIYIRRCQFLSFLEPDKEASETHILWRLFLLNMIERPGAPDGSCSVLNL
jgi:hypothetical protein